MLLLSLKPQETFLSPAQGLRCPPRKSCDVTEVFFLFSAVCVLACVYVHACVSMHTQCVHVCLCAWYHPPQRLTFDWEGDLSSLCRAVTTARLFLLSLAFSLQLLQVSLASSQEGKLEEKRRGAETNWKAEWPTRARQDRPKPTSVSHFLRPQQCWSPALALRHTHLPQDSEELHTGTQQKLVLLRRRPSL